MDKTLAAVLVAPRKIELRELPLPEIDADSGIAKVEITGVCGADWPIYTGALAEYARTPLIPGHEIVARVAKIGARAAKRWGVKEGDRIVMEEYAPCGRCEYCLSGRYYICNGMKMEKMYGFTSLDVKPGLWGGYAEYFWLDPQALLHKLSDKVPLAVAPFYVPLSNGIRWAHLEGGVGIGSTVVIQGPGGQGLASVIAAKEAGAAAIIVTGKARDRARLALAREFGAHHTIDVDATDAVAEVAALTGGRMADTVVNVTANAPGALAASRRACRDGRHDRRRRRGARARHRLRSRPDFPQGAHHQGRARPHRARDEEGDRAARIRQIPAREARDAPLHPRPGRARHRYRRRRGRARRHPRLGAAADRLGRGRGGGAGRGAGFRFRIPRDGRTGSAAHEL